MARHKKPTTHISQLADQLGHCRVMTDGGNDQRDRLVAVAFHGGCRALSEP